MAREKSNLHILAISLLQFSLPLILSGILQQLYSWADAFIVGNIEGEAALGAIGSVGSVINLFILAITGFTVGLSVLTAQKFGAGDREIIPRILGIFAICTGLFFALLAALGYFAAPGLLRLLDTPEDILDMAASYLKIVLAGVPFLAVYNVFSAVVRGIGDSKAPFLAVLLSSLTNVALDILFVAVFHKGVKGAATATLISQVLMTLFLALYSLKKHPSLGFKLTKGLFSASVFKEGMRLGVPPMLQFCVSGAGNLLLQSFMNSFGTGTVAAITTAYRIDSVALLPIINLGSAISTMTAQSFGAGNKRRAKEVFAVGSGIMAVVSLALTAVIVTLGGRLIALFGADSATVEIGAGFFRAIALFYLVFGIATAFRGYLEGLGDVKWVSAVGIISLFIRIISSYALKGLFGNMTIAYAEAVSWVALLALLMGRGLYKMKLNSSPKGK